MSATAKTTPPVPPLGVDVGGGVDVVTATGAVEGVGPEVVGPDGWVAVLVGVEVPVPDELVIPDPVPGVVVWVVFVADDDNGGFDGDDAVVVSSGSDGVVSSIGEVTTPLAGLAVVAANVRPVVPPSSVPSLCPDEPATVELLTIESGRLVGRGAEPSAPPTACTVELT